MRTNLTDQDPAVLWQYYVQLVAVEEAFKNPKGDLAIRPIFHKDERRIEAHFFVAFLAYALQITLRPLARRQGRVLADSFSHALSCHRKPVGAVNEAVEDGVGEGRVTDVRVRCKG